MIKNTVIESGYLRLYASIGPSWPIAVSLFCRTRIRLGNLLFFVFASIYALFPQKIKDTNLDDTVDGIYYQLKQVLNFILSFSMYFNQISFYLFWFHLKQTPSFKSIDFVNQDKR